jgi:hypothetical protein
VSLLLNRQVRVWGRNSELVEVSEVGLGYSLPNHPCECQSLVDVRRKVNSGELINALVHGTIEHVLEGAEGYDKAIAPIHVYAVRGVDGSIVCIHPDCVCRSLHDFAMRNPALASKVLVEVRFLDEREYNLGNEEDLEELRLLAAKLCAMSDDARLNTLIDVVEDFIVMMAMRSGELRDEVVNWLRPDVPSDDLPKGLIKALVERMGIERRSASRVLKHIYVTRRDIILKRISDTSVIRGQAQGKNTNDDDKQGTKGVSEENTAVAKAKAIEEVAVKDAKAKVKEGEENTVKEEGGEGGRQLAAIPCAETNKTELIYSIFRELGIQLDERGAEVSYLLCADFTVHELRVILNKVGSTKSLPSNEQGERLGEVRKLLFSLDEDEIRAYFGLAVAEPGKAEGGAAGSIEYVPPEEEASRAGEDLVRATLAYRDALEGVRETNSRERDRAVERVRDAEAGMLNSYARIHEALFRALYGDDKRAHELAVKYAELFRFTLPNPYVVDDLAELTKNLDAGKLMKIIDTAKHVEARCRELSINCGELWGAVKGAVDHVAEAVRHVREHQGVVGGNSSKRSRSDEAAEEVRAAAEEITSETCSAIEEIRDVLLDIVHNAILDKNLANTVREFLGKAVITRCGAF